MKLYSSSRLSFLLLFVLPCKPQPFGCADVLMGPHGSSSQGEMTDRSLVWSTAWLCKHSWGTWCSLSWLYFLHLLLRLNYSQITAIYCHSITEVCPGSPEAALHHQYWPHFSIMVLCTGVWRSALRGMESHALWKACGREEWPKTSWTASFSQAMVGSEECRNLSNNFLLLEDAKCGILIFEPRASMNSHTKLQLLHNPSLCHKPVWSQLSPV